MNNLNSGVGSLYLHFVLKLDTSLDNCVAETAAKLNSDVETKHKSIGSEKCRIFQQNILNDTETTPHRLFTWNSVKEVCT